MSKKGKKVKYVWIINQNWKGDFSAKKVLKSEADKVHIRQHKTKEECEKAMRT